MESTIQSQTHYYTINHLENTTYQLYDIISQWVQQSVLAKVDLMGDGSIFGQDQQRGSDWSTQSNDQGQDAKSDGQIIYSNKLSDSSQTHGLDKNVPLVQAIYSSQSPIFYSALLAAGLFVIATPVTQFFLFGFYNNWSLTNFTWWAIEFSIAIYVLLIVLPDENLQKIFLLFSHYVQGITIALLLLNLGIFFFTILVWMQEVDLSNVFKNQFEETSRTLSNWELLQTIPTIAYLFLVYFFIVDIRQFYLLQDGTITEFQVSYYTIIGKAYVDSWITTINTFAAQVYGYIWTGLTYTFYPLVWINTAIQWTGKLTLDIVNWSIGIFQITFVWIYTNIVLVIFNWLVPMFQWFASLVPAPVWPA